MVRHRKRKTERGFSENTMKSAVDMVIKHGYSIRRAAAEHNLKHNTLSRYVKKVGMIAPNEAVRMEPNYAWRKIFTSEEENKIKEYVLTYSKINYGLTKADFKKMVYDVAQKNNKKMPTSWKTQKSAGDDWYYGFMERHPDVTLRKPSETSSNEVVLNFDTESNAQLAEDPVRLSLGPNQDCSELTGASATTAKASDAPDCIPICFPVTVSECSWPSSKDGTESDNDMDLNEKLKEWVIKSGILAVHANSLLEILGSHFPQLPKDYDTLLQTRKDYVPIIIEKCEADWEDIGATVRKDMDDDQKGEKSVPKSQTNVNTIDVDCSAGKRSYPWRHPSDDSSANENFCHKRKKTTK